MSVTPAGIGIVTALPIEFAAMRLVLDHPTELHLPRDPTRYVVGSLPGSGGVRPHSVVLALLAHDGTRSAAAATTALLMAFPAVLYVMMVGIAGGVPAVDAPQRHVRLGDIVVATEIVDYGHLRSVDGLRNLRRGLDRPSAHLANADRILQADELTDERPWEDWLDGHHPMPAPFGRPPAETDILTVGGHRIPHPDDFRYGRRPGHPRIHHGAIGSADRLVRDEQLRDTLANDHGICAVEMEGAGIAIASALHATAWFMVRGIVDYCTNSTKSDVWHAYGALAAASYARALIGRVPIAPSSPPSTANESLASLQAIVDALLDLPQVRDAVHRRLLVDLLPRNIREAIHDSTTPRHHVISIVRTCRAYSGGQAALLEALQAIAPSGSDGLNRATAVIGRQWSALDG